MKKLFAILLATFMLMTVAMPIFAESVPADACFKIGTNYYSTFKSAYDAVEDGGTIIMIKDYYAGTKDADGAPATGEAQISVAKSFTLTTENGAKYTYSNAKREDSGLSNFVMHINADGKTVKIENINFDVARGINVTKGTLELTNSSITANRRTAIKADGGVNSTIKLHDSILKTTSECTGTDSAKQEPPVLLNNTESVKFIATGNSKIIRASGNNTNGNASVINVGDKPGNTEITIGTGVQLVLENGVNGTKNDAFGIYLGGKGIATVTLENGSAMYANTTLPNLKFITGSQIVSFTDNGCAFLVKDTLSTIPMPWTSGAGDIYNFVENSSANVSGYKAYKADCTKGEAYFSYIGENDVQNTASTLSAAISLAKSGSVITLLKDYTSSQYELTLNKPIELDLNEKTFTGTGNKKYLFSSVKANFTIKNGTMALQRGFIVYNDGNLLIDGVTMTGASGVLFKLSGVGTPKLTIKDSTITQNTTGEDIVLAETKSDGELNLTGNTVLKYAGGINGNPQNCGIIAVQNAWSGTDPKLPENNTDLVVNVGSGVTLWAAHASSTNANHVAAVIADQSYGNIIVNLEKGATIKLDRTPGASKTKFVNEISTTAEGNADGKTTVNDNGANFVIGAEVAKLGTELPASIFGYSDGTNILTSTTYKNADATESVTLTKVGVGITMNKGASIRTSLPMGIRFGASISAEHYEALLALDENATLGFVIAKSNVAGEKFNVAELKESDYVVYDARHIVLNEEAGVYTFDTTMYEGEDLFEKATRTNLVREFSARAFIKVNGVYYWADFNETDNSRSIYDIAKAYYEDTENGSTTNVVINHILSTCGYEA